MNPQRRTWWIWVLGGVLLVILLAGAAWLLLGPGLQNTAGPATAPPTASATPTKTQTASPTATASPRPTATPTATPTPTPTPTATPTPTTPPAPPVASVTPFIVSAGWDAAAGAISVSANVPGITETDGTCTITASLGDLTISDSYQASASAASTDCGTNSLAWLEFTTGTWNVVVDYSSPTSVGSSSAFPVVIP